MMKNLVPMPSSSQIYHSQGEHAEEFRSSAMASFVSSLAATTAVTELVVATKEATEELAGSTSSASLVLAVDELAAISVLAGLKGRMVFV